VSLVIVRAVQITKIIIQLTAVLEEICVGVFVAFTVRGVLRRARCVVDGY
jgi:hypothetical protein